jgi:hypothetical protein
MNDLEQLNKALAQFDLNSEEYSEGYDAYCEDIPQQDNPYHNEDEHDDWDQGWLDAAWDD